MYSPLILAVFLRSEFESFTRINLVFKIHNVELLFFSESSRKSSTIVALRDGDRLFGTAAETTVCQFLLCCTLCIVPKFTEML